MRTVPHEMQKQERTETTHVEKQKEGGQESYLTFVAYSRIVEKAKHKIADKMYPKTIRDEILHLQQRSTRLTS